MKPSFSFLKRVAFYAVSLSVVAYSLHFYEKSLRELLPEDMEAKAAVDRVVPAHRSLREDEELVYDSPSGRPVALAPAAVYGASNLHVTLSGSVTDENGAVALITFREVPCPPGTPVYGSEIRVHAAQQMEDSLALRLVRSICVPIVPGSVPSVQALRGNWATTGPALPELESAIQALVFTTTEGGKRALYLTALGYCDSEEGDCSAAVGFEMKSAEGGPTSSVYLAGEGDVRLNFTADVE